MKDQFVCKLCGFNDVYEEFKAPLKCPKCGHGFYSLRPYKESNPNEKFVSMGFKDNPRWSWSLGVHVDKIPEMMKKYPDRTYNPKTGQLLIKNRTMKKRYMKEHGAYELC